MTVFLLLCFFQTSSNEQILELVANDELQAVQQEVKKINKSLYSFGIQLSSSAKFGKEAVSYFKWLQGRFPDEKKYVFGEAWSLWRIGDSEKAMKKITYITVLGGDDRLMAKSHYLSGIIHSAVYSRYDIAQKELEKSKEFYEKSAPLSGLYLVYIALANNALHQKKIDQIEPFIAKAIEVNNKLKNPYRIADVYEVRGEYNFHLEDFEAAAKNYKEAAREYKLDRSPYMASRSKAREGLCYSLLGDLESGVKIANDLEGSELSKVPGVREILDLLWIRLKLCSEQDYILFEARVRGEAEKTGNRTVINFLDKLLHMPCP